MKKFLIILFSIAFIIGCSNADKTGSDGNGNLGNNITVDTSKGIEQFAGNIYEGDNFEGTTAAEKGQKAKVEINSDGSMTITVNYYENGIPNPDEIPADEIRYVGGSKYGFFGYKDTGAEYSIEFFTEGIKLIYASALIELYKQ